MKKIASVILLGILTSIVLIACSSFKKKYYVLSKQSTNEKYGEVMNDADAPNSNLIRIKSDKHGFVCTGFILDGRYAATAAHCLANENGSYNHLKYRIYNTHDQYITDAEVLGVYHTLDQGVLRGDFSKFRPSKLVSMHQSIRIPDVYMSCGYPMGQKQLLCTPFTAITTDLFFIKGYGILYPGMSGGPVIDVETNEVVGINSRVGEGYAEISPITGILGAFDLQ